ncbi:gliding motility-associated C-terminal domain-containing protein [Carboxylicivirga sediminis]|uniref:Gliding motility-associated C-terminal domain-containing protein n=1 Tax=Carboxylicivirga sediminis TaxID=2006564 RepID=A0A941F2U1_9BACT|nr:Calx-beta domain-containing protein [Carboxylicivirga sediminis]MBR8535269.1 gliding motility-associated C-terminal domain-containing protein [Carboxylicivirga sediminis]
MNCVLKWTVLVALLSSFSYLRAQEICNNGIDDDGDGLVDHFDPDCDGASGGEYFYFGQPIPGCREKPPVLERYTLVEKYNTKVANSPDPNNPTHVYPTDQRCGMFIGDMDNDGIPDIVSKDPQAKKILIFNGLNGVFKAEVTGVTSTTYSQLAIGDVDANDTKKDVFNVSNAKELGRYSYDYTTKSFVQEWLNTTELTEVNHQTPQLADFNGDGRPEVYVGNQVFDAQTGKCLINKNNTLNFGSIPGNSAKDSYTFAYDIFKPGDVVPNGGGAVFDSKAAGLELIAGNAVYLVDFDPNGAANNGALSVGVEVPIAGLTNGDGFTSIGDLDNDNRIDVVVSSNDGAGAVIYAYNPYTASQIGSNFSIGNSSVRTGRCNLADFDGDKQIEIGVAGKSTYVVIEYDRDLSVLSEKWRKNVDDPSQMTGSTVFDFEGDGKAEVVYSDEQTLYVWRGEDGYEIASVPSPSGTRTDYPLVADVDDDGQAEIIISAQDQMDPGNSPGKSFISVYRSKDAPWVAARETWNQHGYIVTNVGPELAIPANQQEIVNYNFFQEFNEAFNGFLVQTTFLTDWAEPTFAVGDLTTENVIINLDQCVAQKDVTFTVTLQNNGDWKTPRNTPIAVFDGDPYETTARYLGTFYTPENVEVGGTLDVEHTVTDWDGDGWMNLYVLANHYEETLNPGDLLPAKLKKNNSPTLECNYVNNVGFIVKIENCNVSNAPQIDLDRDNSSGTSGNDYTTAFAIQDDVANIVPVLISEPDVLVADDNDDHMQGANIKITNLLDTGYEFLDHPSLGSSVGSISITAVSDGEIRLSGNGTLEEYENIIKSITYENRKTSGINQADRIIDVKVNDGIYDSNVAKSTILLKVEPNLDLDSDDSSVAGRDFETTFTEGGALIPVVDTDVIINTDGDINLQSVSVKLTNILNGVDESLSVVGTLPAGISVTTAYENGIGVIELSGDASAVDYQTALKQIHYNNTSHNPNTTSRVLELKVNDGYLESLVANTTITIIAVNDAPFISGPTTSAVYDRQAATPVLLAPTISITDKDDSDIHSLIIEITAGWDPLDALTDSYSGSTLSVVNDGNGKITVTGPAAINEFEAYIAGIKFSSTTALSGVRTASIYVVKDRNTAEGLSSNVYTRIISIDTPGNDAPIAGDDQYQANEDVVLNIADVSGLLRNDSDPDVADNPIVTLVGGAGANPYNGAYGTLDWSSSGAFIYTQKAGNTELGVGQTMVETVTYTISDGNGGTDQGTISITINGVNDDPVANDDNHSVDENGSITVNGASGLISNDTDVNTPNDVLLVQSIEGTSTGSNVGTYGTLVWSSLGDFTYTPDNSNPLVSQMVAGESIVEIFSYIMHDGHGGTASADLIITIDGEDDAPVISANNVSLAEGVTTVQTVTATDEDSNETKLFSVSGTDADDFNIDPATGELSFKNPTDYENPTDNGSNNIYNITVTVEDKGGLTDSKDIIISVTNIIDALSLQFSAAYYADVENSGGNIPVVVASGELIPTDVTVNASVTGGNATITDDYTHTALVTIPAGDYTTPQNIALSLAIVDESLAEEDETVTFELSGQTAGVRLGSQKTTTYTIQNDDVPSISLSLVGSPILENGGIATITASSDILSANDIVVNLSNTGTATNIVDYAMAGSITIPAGQSSASVSLTAVQDVLDEANETVITDIATVTNGVENGTQQVTTTITDDDDAPTVSLSVDNATIAENGGVATVTASIDAVSALPVTIILAYSGTATLGGTDVTATVGTNANSVTEIVIPAGSTIGTVTITAAQDVLDEADETVIVDIDNVVNAIEASAQQVTTTITDDDNTPVITFVAASSAGDESVNSTDLQVDLSAASGLVVSVDYSVSGTASGTGVDYTLANGTLTLPAGTTTDHITIAGIVDDLLDEDNETVVVTLSNPVNATLGSNAVHTYTITDNDNTPIINFAAASSAGDESVNSAALQVDLSAASALVVSVDYSVTGTATGTGVDYTLANGTLTLPAGKTTDNITIAGIVDDLLDEDNETVVVTLSNPVNATLGANAVHTYTITDNDNMPNVTLSVDKVVIAEDGGVATITASIDAVSGLPVTITLAYSGTATLDGTDATTAAGTNANSANEIVIPPGSTSGTVTITSAADAIYEGNETVIIDVDNVVNAAETTTQQKMVEITDGQSQPTVTLELTGSPFSENGGTANVKAVLSHVSVEDVQVEVTLSGTAAVTDYNATPLNLIIPALVTEATITLTGVNDIEAEGDETVIADITNVVNGSEDGVQQVTAIISDDDVAGLTVVVSGGSNETSEDKTTDSFEVVLNTQPANDVVINITGLDATEGELSATSLTFTNADWDQAQMVTITGKDDNLIDGTIDYVLTLVVDNISSDDAYDDLSTTTTVRNLDNDVADFTLSKNTLSTNENGATDDFTIVLTAEPVNNVVLLLSESDDEGTVVSPVTFTPANWNKPQTVVVTPEDDLIVDGDQTYDITISVDAANSDDGFDLVTSKIISVTNIDNDTAGLSVTQSDGSTGTSESGASDSFDVVLYTQPISNVVIIISGIDATEGSLDVTSLTFTPANWNIAQTVTVTGQNDSEIDGDINYTLKLSVDNANSDDAYDGLSEVVEVTNIDDDSANSAPFANDDIASIQEGDVLNGTSVLNNDSDPDNHNLVVNTTPVVNVTHGTLVLNVDGSFVYTPNHRFFGTDSFTYEVCDDASESKCATATVTITVTENTDRDNDGIDNDREGDDDLDGDGIPNDEDEDADGDGILDSEEGDVDTDGDGTPDYKDLDSDDDGILDEDEGNGDTDGDGLEDYRDDDSDDDGIQDSEEGDVDSDGDGTPDYKDLDSDDDGILDEDEGNGDTDGDGLEDFRDEDSDDDGILDSEEGDVDTDGDGTPDYKDLDSDDDGVLDADESKGDCDRDGIPDRIDEDNCYDELEVLEGFSPNGDGVNDNFIIAWLDQYNKVSFEVFNRWGNIVYRKDKYQNDWNGISNIGFSIGDELPVGTYYYIIVVEDTGEKLQGYIYLNR